MTDLVHSGASASVPSQQTDKPVVSGHTPGPWEFWPSYDAVPHSVVGPVSWRVPEASVGRIVDVSHYGSCDARYSSEQSANGRLIAAAPELLAACRWAEAALAPFSKDPAEKSGISMLRAAIAKAEASA